MVATHIQSKMEGCASDGLRSHSPVSANDRTWHEPGRSSCACVHRKAQYAKWPTKLERRSGLLQRALRPLPLNS